MPDRETPHLSDTMERALIALVDLARSDREAGVERRWHNPRAVVDRPMEVYGIGVGTVVALQGRDFVETRKHEDDPYRAVVRATDAGIALCDSMGD
jgi:hypothetical protein